jgi:hypothetical protein
MSQVFLSYAREDRGKAESLAAALMVRGWSVWFDRQINPGSFWDEDIERELRSAECVVVLWSKFSAGSHWVRTEAEEARERRILVPAKLDNAELPYAFKRIQAADLSDWSDNASHEGFEDLVRGISQVLGQTAAPKPVAGKPWHRRVIAILLGAVPLLAIAALTMVRLPETEVDLQVKASGVTFTLARNEEVSDLLAVAAIRASGFESLRLPRTATEPERTTRGGRSHIVLLPGQPDNRDALTLEPVILRPGTRATYEKMERPQTYGLAIRSSGVEVTANLQNRVRVQLPGEAARILDFGSPKALTMRSGTGVMQLEFTLPSPVENVLPGRIAIRDLTLLRIEERVNVREVSTVISGRVGVGRRVYDMSPSERFVAEASEGVIESIRLDSDAMTLRFKGRARRVSVCPHEKCQDLSMTWAMWFWMQYRWYSAVIAATYCALAVLALRRLWAV